MEWRYVLIRKVLVGMDGTENAAESLRFVRELLPDADLCLIRVIEYLDTLPAYQEVLWTQRRKQVEEYLDDIQRSLERPATILIKEGSPAHEILEAADAEQVDAIVLTTHGGSSTRRRFLGGTTEKLLHSSRVPLLVLPHVEDKAHHGKLDRIMVPLDGSQIAEAILPLANDIARAHEAKLILVKVLEDSAEAERQLPEIQSRLQEAAHSIEPSSCFDKVLVRMGEPARTLARAADMEDVSLITMSAHGYGAMKRMLLGSVASKLMRETRVPVLMARYEALYDRKPDN
jgi:nucleotide-binding universal stress UspA family protein